VAITVCAGAVILAVTAGVIVFSAITGADLPIALERVLPPMGLEVVGPITVGIAFLAVGAILHLATRRIDRDAEQSRAS
jgi:uncharacterized membrane-anchored protein